jgi:hypothetical protein
MGSNQNLKAYVRYDGQKKIVPGSLILRENKPTTGTFVEVMPVNLCCGTTTVCDSCVTLQAVGNLYDDFNPFGVYGFTLQTRSSGANLTGTIHWTTSFSESFSLDADGDDYDFQYDFGDAIPHTVLLCVNNPSQIQDFELGFGPGDTVSLNNAIALNGLDEWDSDGMDIYSLDLTGLSSIDELYHCCSVLTHINITGCTNLDDVELTDNDLTEASVDHVLISLDNYGLSNGYVDLSGGTNAIPSVAGDAAILSLQGKGWSVNVNV